MLCCCCNLPSPRNPFPPSPPALGAKTPDFNRSPREECVADRQVPTCSVWSRTGGRFLSLPSPRHPGRPQEPAGAGCCHPGASLFPRRAARTGGNVSNHVGFAIQHGSRSKRGGRRWARALPAAPAPAAGTARADARTGRTRGQRGGPRAEARAGGSI